MAATAVGVSVVEPKSGRITRITDFPADLAATVAANPASGSVGPFWVVANVCWPGYLHPEHANLCLLVFQWVEESYSARRHLFANVMTLAFRILNQTCVNGNGSGLFRVLCQPLGYKIV
jgi:hypothetical protein